MSVTPGMGSGTKELSTVEMSTRPARPSVIEDVHHPVAGVRRGAEPRSARDTSFMLDVRRRAAARKLQRSCCRWS